ncbi:TolC family protein [Desulfomonile tiedjei]|uniref:Outer membrane protein n=1 Tax=Desulfomonile tiedjei (strain ATCC 49306 / DSM 6799 / DCB-1) TaxID=706587 RepID=I4C2N9_DESTA|nr:TolC family protein [Desulfomonile tiedjei]AFM23830.1 outer membrane protein [Desulfomonile tiedjei DSM 6799]
MGCSNASKCLFTIAILGLLLAVIPLAANAAESNRRNRADSRLSLAQAVSISLTRNLRMADARLDVREKESQRREAYSDFFPTIDLQYAGTGYRYQSSTAIASLTGTHPSRWAIRGDPSGGTGLAPTYPYRIDPFKLFSMSATITQPLYTGGKLLNDYKYARLGVDYSAIQFDVERQDLTLDVYEAYYQLVQAEKLLEVADASIRALEALRNQTLEFYKAGVVPKVDVLSTEGQLATAKIQRTQALTDIGKSKATLNFLLRYPQETPIDVIQDTAYRPNNYAIPAIYGIAAANRVEIRQANISVEQALALVKSAKADLLPSIQVQGQASRINDDWNTFDPEGTNDWRLQGILSWTFDMFRQRETVQERRVTQARAFVAREQLVEQIMEEVKTSFLDMKRSESDIENNRKAVEFRRENFRINQERYKEQVATYIEVLDAQRQLSSAEGDLIVSLIGYKTNQANLERRLGTIR